MADVTVSVYGSCGRCYGRERREYPGGLAFYEPLPEDAHTRVTPAVYRYSPACTCGMGCGDEYLCGACAEAGNIDPYYLEFLL